MDRLVTQNLTSGLRMSDKVYIFQCAELKTSVGFVYGFFCFVLSFF